MRIYTDKIEQFVQSLASTLGRDPASLESWRCAHILPGPSAEKHTETAHNALLDTLHALYEKVDITLLFCPDGDLMLIGRAVDRADMQSIEEFLIRDFLNDAGSHVTQYDLFFNWREIRKILLAKVTNEVSSATSTISDADFGQIEMLHEVFDQSRKVREARNPLHILFVEDDPMTLRLVSSMFKDKYAVLTAKDAQEAIVNYLMHAPDIVFLDINLPDHNGFQVLKRIIENDPAAYVVMFSGSQELDTIMQALNAGASGFVSKPFSKEKMRHYIEDCAFASHKS